MFGNIEAVFKKRVLIVVLMIHAGLGAGICALSRQTLAEGWDLTSTFLCASVVLLYGGFLFGVLSVLIPLIPWLRKAQKVEHWTERLVRDLPQVLALIQNLMLTWKEVSAPKSMPSSPQPEKIQA